MALLARRRLVLLIFGAAFALQWGMGEVINLWPVSADGAYSVIGYRAAFGVALALPEVVTRPLLPLRPTALTPKRAPSSRE